MGIRRRERWWHPAEGYPSCPNCREDYPNVRGQNEVWHEEALGAGWLAALRLATDRGHLVVAELRIFPADGDCRDAGTWRVERESIAHAARLVPRGGLTTRKLREVAIERALKAALPALRDHHEFIRLSAVDSEQQEHADEMPLAVTGMPAAVKAEQRRQNPRGVSDLYLAEIACRYERLWNDPATRRKVSKSLAAETGESESRARRLVFQARERGMLTGGGRGRSGGSATPTARTLLQRHAQGEL